MKKWYEELFSNYADNYDKESFTQGTIGEVDFLEQELNYDKSKKILDIGCGTGRHAIELAQRGYNVTGIDLSETQIKKAIQKAEENDVPVRFFVQDALKLEYEKQFDFVIMLCEGAFSLMETDEMNFKILQNAAKAMKPQGKFIFNALNALFPIHNDADKFFNEHAHATETQSRFDLLTFRLYSTMTYKDDEGQENTIHANERYYAPSEIIWLLKQCGFTTIEIFGCKIGEFSKSLPLTEKEVEMLVIAT